MPETTMKVTKDTVTISGLDYGRQNQVQLKDADPIELQLFIEKLPASIKGKTKSMKCNFQYFFFYFGFETKMHLVEPLAVRDVVYRYRPPKLMARGQ